MRTPNRSCYTCIAHLAQVLVATSFRPAAGDSLDSLACDLGLDRSRCSPPPPPSLACQLGLGTNCGPTLLPSSSPPPPPSPPASQAGCACDTISIVLTGGAASSSQSFRAGQYVKTSTTQHGRPVYAQTGGSQYLFFWGSGDWAVGGDYSSGGVGLHGRGGFSTQCPEAQGDSWQYYSNGEAWTSGGVEVKCAPCACDTVSLVLTGAALTGRQSDTAGQYAKTSTMKDGRAVYAQTTGSNYLFFEAVAWDWYVWTDYTSNYRGVESTSNGNTQCPEAEGDTWQYFDGFAMQSGGVEVKCALCACDTISIVLTGGALSSQSVRAGQYVKTSTMKDGRAVYAQTSGSNYLYFRTTHSDWSVGPDYTSGAAWLDSASNGNTHCPEDANDSCQDSTWLCPSWAAAGECEANAAFMLAECRLSCGCWTVRPRLEP